MSTITYNQTYIAPYIHHYIQSHIFRHQHTGMVLTVPINACNCTSSCTHIITHCIRSSTHTTRVGQNHIYIRYFWLGNQQIYGHIRCIYTVLANPTYNRTSSYNSTLSYITPWAWHQLTLSLCVGVTTAHQHLQSQIVIHHPTGMALASSEHVDLLHVYFLHEYLLHASSAS